jgi:hypothetical protein
MLDWDPSVFVAGGAMSLNSDQGPLNEVAFRKLFKDRQTNWRSRLRKEADLVDLVPKSVSIPGSRKTMICRIVIPRMKNQERVFAFSVNTGMASLKAFTLSLVGEPYDLK